MIPHALSVFHCRQYASNIETTQCNQILRRLGRTHSSEAGIEIAGARHRALSKQGVAVTFIVHASRGEEAATTIRLSVVVAIAKGQALAEEGWQVFITGPDGIRYYPSEFDKLLLFSPALHSRE